MTNDNDYAQFHIKMTLLEKKNFHDKSKKLGFSSSSSYAMVLALNIEYDSNIEYKKINDNYRQQANEHRKNKIKLKPVNFKVYGDNKETILKKSIMFGFSHLSYFMKCVIDNAEITVGVKNEDI